MSEPRARNVLQLYKQLRAAAEHAREMAEVKEMNNLDWYHASLMDDAVKAIEDLAGDLAAENAKRARLAADRDALMEAYEVIVEAKKRGGWTDAAEFWKEHDAAVAGVVAVVERIKEAKEAAI